MIVNELKKSIYLAAFQGKLSSHHENDSNVNEQINKIIIYKKIDLKEIKRRKINDDYIEPYSIPNSWKWVKLGYLCDIIRGLTFSSSSNVKKDNNILVLRGGNIDSKSEELVFDDNIYVDCSIPNKNQYLQNGDTLIVASSGTKTSVGKSSLIHDIDNNISFGGFMMVVRPYCEIANQKYISYQIKMYRNKIINDTNGYFSNITNEILNNLLIPLPPIEEQQRIVDKVEQLFDKLDEIKPIEEELTHIKEKFPTEMKNSILKEAFSGKLVENSKNIEDIIKVEEIVKRLNNKYKKIDNKSLPNSWKIFKFGDLFNIINGFTPLKSNEEFWNKKEISWFTVEDINEQGRIINYTKQYITSKAIAKNSKRILPKNTVLLCCTASVGEYAITNIELTTNQQFNGLVIKEELKNYIYPMYVYEFVQTLKSKLILKSGKTTFNFLSTKKLAEFEIPLPPIEEQQRIVDKLEKLLPLCDDIDKIVGEK